MSETVILAIGGNALAPAGLGEFADQESRARGVAETAVRMIDGGVRLVVVHGNGPQVGALAMAQEAVSREVPTQPLFVLGRDDAGPARLPAGAGDRRHARRRAASRERWRRS